MKADFDTNVAAYLDQQVSTQWAHCQIWITQFQKHRDGASVRNLAYALGRVSGAYGVLITYMKDKDVNEATLKISQDCAHWFDQMGQVSLVVRKD